MIFGQMIFGQMIFGQMIFGQLLENPSIAPLWIRHCIVHGVFKVEMVKNSNLNVV